MGFETVRERVQKSAKAAPRDRQEDRHRKIKYRQTKLAMPSAQQIFFQAYRNVDYINEKTKTLN